MVSEVRKRMTAILLVGICMSLVGLPLFAANNEKIERMEFFDMPIVEILISLAKIKNTSIIPDDTIFGNTTFVFFDKTVDEAFDLFVASHNLYLIRNNGIYYVSRINVNYNDEDNRISMDATDVNLRQLLDTISKAIDKSIYYDPLPTLTPLIHANNMTPEELIRMLLVQAPDYILDVNPNYYNIRLLKPTPGPTTQADNGGPPDVSQFVKNGEFYTINKKKLRFLDLIHDIFNREGKEYSMMMKRDVILDVVKFADKRFEELLSLILEQANADFYVAANGVYYIFEIAQRDILKDYKEYEYVPLQYISPNDFQRIIPANLGNSQFFRIDTNTNSVILSGSEKEIDPIRKFIAQIDKPLGGNQYYRYDLNFIKAGNIKSMLPNKYRQMEIITLPDTNSIIMLLTPTAKRYMDEFLEVLDKTVSAKEITLKYIKAEDLLKNLPPSVSREDVVITGNPSIIFFKGTPEKQEVFQQQLDIFDTPVPQIRYEVLVLSYSEEEGLTWNNPAEGNIAVNLFQAPGAGTIQFVGALSKILSLNFDIASVLGITGALNLNVALSNNLAKVMTDTTIYGVSGEKISFKDTEVFRYQTQAADTGSGSEDSTPPALGPIQEITTGFTLDVEGWVSGDNMITMKVNITIKKQGSAGENAASLGSTFDKVYNTTVRSPSGEPFKVGGLIKQDKIETIDTIPFLGQLPLIGHLFQRKNENIRKSEIVVYILPHIEEAAEELIDGSLRIAKLYNKYLSANRFQD